MYNTPNNNTSMHIRDIQSEALHDKFTESAVDCPYVEGTVRSLVSFGMIDGIAIGWWARGFPIGGWIDRITVDGEEMSSESINGFFTGGRSKLLVIIED